MFDKSKFESVFSPLKKNSLVAIFLQHSPDPDALGAAVGLSLLLKQQFKLKSKIYHHGEISHPQNKSMKNILHIPLETGEDFDQKEISATVVLDTDFSSTGFVNDTIKSVDVRIDHHYMERDVEPKYEDVRIVGSTCSIIWDYLREYNIELQEHADVATAMLLGIKTDTLEFTTATTSELDLTAYRSLLPYVNMDSLVKITNFSIPKIIFEKEVEAYQKRVVKDTALVSFIGEQNSQHRDIIAHIADRFARMDGINTVMIMGVVDKNLVSSVRSIDSRVDVSDLCCKVFGKEFSGAKDGSGGARVPLDHMLNFIQNEEVKQVLLSEVCNTFQNKFFEALGE